MTVERVAVFGLGYVGCVSAACFAKEGFHVIGVDPTAEKVALVKAGTPTVLEAGLGEIVQEMVSAGRLDATTDARAAVLSSDLSLVCVGTPSRTNGSLDLRYIERVCEEIGRALQEASRYHVVVIRSTVLPGTIRKLVIPTLERSSGKRCGVDFGVASNPEFLREGTSIADFYAPPFTIIGADNEQAGRHVAELYKGLDAPLHRVEITVAEMIKYTCNAFHALKVAFANEIGALSKAAGIDGMDVMRLVCQDTKLNISPAYLRPGFAFGGSCLPKDVRALSYRGRELDMQLPLLTGILDSNTAHAERGYALVESLGHKRVGILGITFKAGTDDLRESPMVSLVERLIGRGYDVRIYDQNVTQSKLIGTNRAFIEREIPHIWNLMVGSIDEAVAHGDTVLIGNAAPEFRRVLQSIQQDKQYVDLVRLGTEMRSGERYQGMCW
jgi:GDP-mannose 6-dehydrogenase